MRFEFATAGLIVFGPGVIQEAGRRAAGFGRQALVACGPNLERVKPLLEVLTEFGVAAERFLVAGEPTLDLITAGAAQAREIRAELVIGFGGGSALDTAKAIAAAVTNPGDLLDYLEVVGKGNLLTESPLPVIAIPTTAGTGSEVTRNAVIGVPEQRVKVSLRSPGMLPRVALVDPELTYSLPPEETAATGMDALTQVLEPFVSRAAQPLSDAVCREGLVRAGRSLLRAYRTGTDEEARQDLSIASLCGGLALANAKLGAVHGFAAPLGGMFSAPHGALCAVLLAPVMRANLRAVRSREPQNPALSRYVEVARYLTGDTAASADDGIAWLEKLTRELNIPSLTSYGITPADFEGIAERAEKASSMAGNPIRLSRDELMNILHEA
jgi:alcohol dehydrogenase class IV